MTVQWPARPSYSAATILTHTANVQPTVAATKVILVLEDHASRRSAKNTLHSVSGAITCTPIDVTRELVFPRCTLLAESLDFGVERVDLIQMLPGQPDIKRHLQRLRISAAAFSLRNTVDVRAALAVERRFRPGAVLLGGTEP
jgi:hypothetical protein